ncbi:MAG: toxin-antitoxin system HicB family antitoxin [Proteobacteria bacterium]|nr:toxin-antitoxin system HicB family antitoxin [Pseudomonadota bacterium]
MLEYKRRNSMSKMSLRLPDSLHETTKILAKKDHISVNQFVTTAVAEKISALMTENYLEERAKRGTREKFEEVMAKVPDVEPAEYDKL